MEHRRQCRDQDVVEDALQTAEQLGCQLPVSLTYELEKAYTLDLTEDAVSNLMFSLPAIEKNRHEVDPKRYKWLMTSFPYQSDKSNYLSDCNNIASVAMASWRLLPFSLSRTLEQLSLCNVDSLSHILKARSGALQTYTFIQVSFMKNILEMFHKAGVITLLLKGTAARFELYGDPLHRASRDIDLAVPSADYHRAWNMLLSDGFIPALWSSKQRRFLPDPDELQRLRKEGDLITSQHLNVNDSAILTKLVRVDNIDPLMRKIIEISCQYSTYPWIMLPDGGLACYILIELVPDGCVGLAEDVDVSLIFGEEMIRPIGLEHALLPPRAVTAFQIATKLFRHIQKESSPFLWSNHADIAMLIEKFTPTDNEMITEIINYSPVSREVIFILKYIFELLPHLKENESLYKYIN